MITVEMRRVSVRYGKKPVLDDITCALKPGELTGLIGPNGSGKSTIIRALSRTVPVTSGMITFNGRNIDAVPRREFARLLGVVPQMPLLPSAFTAFEIVLLGRHPHLGLLQREGPQEVAITWEAMARTGTQALAERPINELSGGEIQCILIARVIAQRTEVILLDEPTANLDIGRQVEMLSLIRGLCRESRLTVLAAIHDLNLAAQYCDRLVMIDRGRVYAEGTPAEVITAANVKEVYGADSCVYTHPVNGLPVVLHNACGAAAGALNGG
ncbi:MAG: ABC transporter ATP-binding protein [Chloroflexi bacterium]|nr:ABC transporter ATP-binding protein [Chloroflexota bacterium]